MEGLASGQDVPRYAVTPNAHHIVEINKNRELRRIYEGADLVLPDGVSLLWASRLLGTPLRERVAGSDLFPRLCAAAAEYGYRVFLLGGEPGVASKAAEQLKRRHPGLRIVGFYSPQFGFESCPEENERIVRMTRESRPDILFVALGFPKQELWIYRYARACRVSIAIGVGAAFDFAAGTRRRAPRWMQRVGLEWLFRLLQEPRRLWYRYLVLGPQFALLTVAEFCRSRIRGMR